MADDDNRERDRLLAEIRRFEAELGRDPIVTRSPCGRIEVKCDHSGELLSLEISDRLPRDVDVDTAERLIVSTMNTAIAAPEVARERFYSELSVFGDTIANWRKHPPSPRSREGMALGFVDILRTGMKARSHIAKGLSDDA